MSSSRIAVLKVKEDCGEDVLELEDATLNCNPECGKENSSIFAKRILVLMQHGLWV
jgi:hypothetical protein